MSFCTSCGQQLAENQKFCTNCGAPVAAQQQTTVNESAPQQASPYQQASAYSQGQTPYQQATQGVPPHSQQTAGEGSFDPTQIPGYIPGYQPGQAQGASTGSFQNPYGGQPYGQPTPQQWDPSMGQPAQQPKKKKTWIVVVLVLVALLIVGPIACGACAMLVLEDEVFSDSSVELIDGSSSSKGVDQMVGTWTLGFDDSSIAFQLKEDGTVKVSEDGSSFVDVGKSAKWESYGIDDGMCVMSIDILEEKNGINPFRFQICFPDGAGKGNVKGEYKVMFSDTANQQGNSSLMGIGSFAIGLDCKKNGKAELNVTMGSLNTGVDGTWTEAPVNNGWGINAVADNIGSVSITHYK